MDSRRERILANLKDTLEQMTEGAGYSYDWHTIYRSAQTKELSGFPSALIETGLETVEPYAYPLFKRSLTVEIQAVHKVSNTVDDEPDAAASRLISDIEAAVMQDITRGGDATDCLIVSNDRDTTMPPYVYVFVTLAIHYRTRLTDPSRGQ